MASCMVFYLIFLHNRIQRVVLPDGASSYDFVSSGVPQGSVLGPLLFLIYVNDVADLFTDGSCVKMYADDVCYATPANL